jgi:hypothetical protein
MRESWIKGGQTFRLSRVGEHPLRPRSQLRRIIVLLGVAILTLDPEIPDRMFVLRPPEKMQRQVAPQRTVPTLRRTSSLRVETWPGAAKPAPKLDGGLSTASLLSMLVTGLYHKDSESEDDDDDGVMAG